MSTINTYKIAGNMAFVSGTYSSLTSGSIVKAKSFLIPANTFGTGDVITIQAGVSRLVNVGNLNVRIYWNETDDLINTPVQISQSAGSVADNFSPHNKTIFITSPTNASSFNFNATVATDFGSTDSQELDLTLFSTSAVNWTVNSYIILAVDSGASFAVRYFRVLK